MTSPEMFEIVKYRKLYDLQYTAFIRQLIQINSEEKNSGMSCRYLREYFYVNLCKTTG